MGHVSILFQLSLAVDAPFLFDPQQPGRAFTDGLKGTDVSTPDGQIRRAWHCIHWPRKITFSGCLKPIHLKVSNKELTHLQVRIAICPAPVGDRTRSISRTAGVVPGFEISVVNKVIQGVMMAGIEPISYRIRIGVTCYRELDDPAAIEWQRRRLVPEVSIPMDARSGPIRLRTLLVWKDHEQVAGEEAAIWTHRCSRWKHRDSERPNPILMTHD
jgi:hypothetical protein